MFYYSVLIVLLKREISELLFVLEFTGESEGCSC